MVIQDAISLILHCRATLSFRATFKYINHFGCAINLHSIINSGLIFGGWNFRGIKRQYSFSLWIPETRVTRILIRSSWVRRVMHNKYMHKAWKRHENGVYWVDINLVLKKGLKLYQTGLNAFINYETPQLIVSRRLMMGSVENIYEEVHASPRLRSQIFFQKHLDERIGFWSCWRW